MSVEDDISADKQLLIRKLLDYILEEKDTIIDEVLKLKFRRSRYIILYTETKIVKYISFFDDVSGCLYRGRV